MHLKHFRSPEKWSLEKTKKEDILLQSAKMSKRLNLQ